ncbi:MAG: polysaccharide deacetylase family protein [Nanoarchaeota archaeon]
MKRVQLVIVIIVGIFTVILLTTISSILTHVTLWGSEKAKQEKKISLTFDDGPSPEYTPRILDILKEENVTATFFLIGKNAEQHPELVRRIVAEGHSIGVHSYSHPLLVFRTQARMELEIRQAKHVIENQTNQSIQYFRPPYGIIGPRALAFTKKEHLDIIDWSLDAQDYRIPDSQKIADRVVSKARPGDIIVLHDAGGKTRNASVEALPRIIKELREKGYAFSSLDMLLT